MKKRLVLMGKTLNTKSNARKYSQSGNTEQEDLMSETPSWQELLELVEQLSNSEFESASVQFGNISVRLSKNDRLIDNSVDAAASLPILANASPTPASAPTKSSETVSVEPSLTNDTSTDTVDAPMVGVFYRRPSPGADVFVKPGDTVTAETTIGIIEIMKLMNPVVAGKAGVLGEFLVEDAGTVEFGQPLVEIIVG